LEQFKEANIKLTSDMETMKQELEQAKQASTEEIAKVCIYG